MSSSNLNFRRAINTLRGLLTDEKNCLYFMHTSLGVINVSTWHYGITGFVIVTGEDENNNYRCLVFPEETVCLFPLEVKKKSSGAKTKSKMGFKVTLSKSGKEDSV